MSEISYIVNSLNSPPFNRGLRVVEFHDKSPRELQLELGEVIAAIDPKQPRGDALKNEPLDSFGARTASFLQMCRFQVPQDVTGFKIYLSGLTTGDKAVVYPTMLFLLQRIPQLQKRAYVGHFLMPIQVPPEFQHDPNLIELHEQYKNFQEEFKATHKVVDALRDNNYIQPQDLKADIRQLEKEKEQLKERIEKQLYSASKEPGFNTMLKITTALRHAQEEEASLAKREEEQKVLLLSTENQLSEVTQRLEQINAYKGSNSAEEIIAQLKNEVDSLSVRTKQILPKELLSCKRDLKRLETAQHQHNVTGDDINGLYSTVSTLREENEATKQIIEKALMSRGDSSNISMFRQQAALATKRAKEKELEFKDLLHDRDALLEEVREQERLAAEEGGNGSHKNAAAPPIVTMRHSKLHDIHIEDENWVTAEYTLTTKIFLTENQLLVVASQQESTVLTHTVQEDEKGSGRSTEENKEEFPVDRNEDVGLVKLNSHHHHLEETSDLVNHISKQQLKSPTVANGHQHATIDELDIARKELHDLEAVHGKTKNRYNKVAAGFEVEPQRLERECDELQEETIMEETSYHSLVTLNNNAKETLKRSEQEEAWQRGEGRLHPDFQCYKDLYEGKLRQQEHLIEQLQHKQSHLTRLIELKSKRNEIGSSSESKDDTYYKALDVVAAGTSPSFGNRMGDGGANVMKLE